MGIEQERLTRFEHMNGKTVKLATDIDLDRYGITFTDGSFIVLEAIPTGWDDDEAELQVSREPLDALGLPELELIDDEECDRLLRAEKQVRQDDAARKEREEYERLRAKFESIPVSETPTP